MNRYRAIADRPKLRIIDNLGNFIYKNNDYYMTVCPACGCKNPDHAIGSGKCYRCKYKLSYKDEQ